LAVYCSLGGCGGKRGFQGAAAVNFSSLWAYPVATISSFAFYVVMIALAVPISRRVVAPLFAHPIAPHQQYLMGFDALRGFAAAFVALSHCWWATYPVFASTQLAVQWVELGTKGVDVFAVLSGFLIYRSGLAAITSIAKLREYVIRRFFRIYPVYLLGVALCLATHQYAEGPLFFSDLFMFRVLEWPAFANPPTWSLYVEVAFYAALPLVLLAVGQKRILIICLIGLAAMVLADNPSRVFTLWRYFLFGIIASELSPSLKKPIPLVAMAVGVGLVWVDFSCRSCDWAAHLGIGLLHSDGQTMGLGIGCGLVLAALPHLRSAGAALNILPFRVIGSISYSVYITHFFYIRANFPEIELFSQAGNPLYQHFAQLPQYPAWYLPLVFFPGVLFWGAVSFLLIERPGMQFGKYLINRRRQPAHNTVVAPAE
jgi:peptidoglycan/LPS O-acetylase OafA/YrhL